MYNAGRVQGSAEMAKPVVVGKTTVYVHTNIVKLDTDSEGNSVDNLFEYDEIQYSKDEYISLLQVSPYSETKKAYIGDTNITFSGVPDGNVMVYFPYEYSIDIVADRVTVSFAELEEVTDITIKVL